ncbi:hypothetical protein ACLOJK_035166 [Asimina triloba]
MHEALLVGSNQMGSGSLARGMVAVLRGSCWADGALATDVCCHVMALWIVVGCWRWVPARDGDADGGWMKVNQMALQPAVIGMMGCLARAELLAGVGEEGATIVGGDGQPGEMVIDEEDRGIVLISSSPSFWVAWIGPLGISLELADGSNG